MHLYISARTFATCFYFLWGCWPDTFNTGVTQVSGSCGLSFSGLSLCYPWRYTGPPAYPDGASWVLHWVVVYCCLSQKVMYNSTVSELIQVSGWDFKNSLISAVKAGLKLLFDWPVTYSTIFVDFSVCLGWDELWWCREPPLPLLTRTREEKSHGDHKGPQFI